MKEIHVRLTDEQHAWLTAESRRTSVSIAELVRRPLDVHYRLDGRPRTRGIEFNLSIWRRRIFGRRSGIPFDR